MFGKREHSPPPPDFLFDVRPYADRQEPPPGEIDERYVQKQFGHTSGEMTRRCQRRRDRFRVNLIKAAGL